MNHIIDDILYYISHNFVFKMNLHYLKIRESRIIIIFYPRKKCVSSVGHSTTIPKCVSMLICYNNMIELFYKLIFPILLWLI